MGHKNKPTTDDSIERVAEDFIQTVLRDRPVLLYDLDEELSWYISDNKEIEKKFDENSLELQEYRKSPNGKEMDATIYEEVLSKANVLLNKGKLPYDYLDTTEYTESKILADNMPLYYLVHLVLKNDNIRIRRMHEIEEEELDHPVLPNRWIYHKDSNLDEVLDYIKDMYDSLQFEEEEEEVEDSHK